MDLTPVKEIRVSDLNLDKLDTPDIILEKIGQKINELPRYVYLGDFEFKGNELIQPVVCYNYIKESLEHRGNLDVQDLKNKFPKATNEELLFMVLKAKEYSTDDNQESSMMNMAIELEISEYSKLLIGRDAPNEGFVRFYKGKVTEYKKDLETFKRQIKEKLNKLGQFGKLSDTPLTEFELHKIVFVIELDIQNSANNILELFDLIDTKPYTPFASLGEYYKLYRDFRYLGADWDVTLESHIIVKILSTDRIPKAYNDSMFAVAYISIKDGKALVNMKVDYKISKDVIIDRLLSIFPTKYPVLSDEQESLNGVFYVPRIYMNKTIMSDLIMNNILVSPYVYSDEHVKATKTKPGVHFYYENEGSDIKKDTRMSINITSQYADPSDRSILMKSRDLFPFNEYYTRVKIQKARNLQDINKFRIFLSKFITLYTKEYNNILNDYRRYIPEFTDEKGEEEKVIVKKQALKNIYPDLFIAGYSKKCVKKQQPVIVDDKIDIEETEDGKYIYSIDGHENNVMLFPKTRDEGIQHFYGCPNSSDSPNSQFRHPGIIESTLSNKEKFPYIPCCYPNSQVGNTNWKSYFEGIKEIKIYAKKTGVHCLKSNKIAPDNECGVLPININNLFETLNTNIDSKYYRLGMTDSPNSFIECLKKATNDSRGISQLRELMSNPDTVSVCRQQCYDMTPDQIINYIKDPKLYFDPKKFISIAEYVFKCRVYLFTRNKEYPLGNILLANHLDPYIEYNHDPSDKVVFIYEHRGTENVVVDYPRCELIIRKSDEYNKLIFKGTDKIVRKFEDFYNHIVHQYSLSGRSTSISKIDIREMGIICQGIDSYGKTRLLVFKNDGEQIYGFTDPLPPLPLSEDCKYQENTRESIEKFIKNQNMIEIKSNNPNEMIASKNTLIIKFPIIQNQKSMLSDYSYLKRSAYYVLEYSYYLFSKYWSTRQDRDIDTNINNFIKDQCIVVPNHIYNTRDNIKDNYVDGDRLILSSEKIKLGLAYNLKRMAVYRNKDLKDYHTRNKLEKIFVDRKDFITYPNTVIIFGKNLLANWNTDRNTSHRLYDLPQIRLHEAGQSYFMKMNNSPAEPLRHINLIQPCDSIEKAIYVSSNWNRSGMIKFPPAGSVLKERDCMAYIISRSNRVDTVVRKSKGARGLASIIVFKMEDKVYYGALLPLN